MAVTHFDPYFDIDEDVSRAPAPCGVDYPDIGGRGTLNWDYVTCKRCLRAQDRLQRDWEKVLREEEGI